MPRDVSNISLNGDLNFGPPPGPFAKITSVHWLKQTVRDDPKNTARTPSGKYFQATDYYGQFYSGTRNVCDYTVDLAPIGSPIPRRWFGDSGSGSVFPSLATWQRSAGGHPATPLWLTSSCESRVMNSIRNGDMNLGQTLGEAPETVRFILGKAEQVLKLYRAVRKGDASGIHNALRKFKAFKAMPSSKRRKAIRKFASNARKDAAGTWLQLQFAWKPLLADIDDATRILADGLSQSDILTASAEGKTSCPAPLPDVQPKIFNFTWSGEHSVEVKVTYKITNPLLYDLEKLGLLNPLSLAWELVPLSFVIDWFLPIGNFLQALTQPFGISFSTGYRTSVLTWNYNVDFTHQKNQRFTGGKKANVGGELFCFRRQVYNGFPVPVPAFRGLGNLNLSVGKLASLLALAAR